MATASPTTNADASAPGSAAPIDADAPYVVPPPSMPSRSNLKKLTVLRRLLGLVAPYKLRFAIATVALFVGSSISLVYPQAVRFAIDSGMAAGSLQQLDMIVAGLVALFLLQGGLTWLRHYLMSWLGERAVADLRRIVFDKILRLPLAWFHARRTGELVGRLASDVTIVEGVVGTELSMALRNGVQLLGGLVLLFIENAKLTALMLAIVPPLSVGVVLFGRRIRWMTTYVQDRLSEASGRVQEALGAMQTVQAFVREKHELDRYGEGVEKAFREALRLARWRGAFYASSSLAGMIGIAAIIWVGGRAVIQGEMSAGDLTAFMLYTSIVAISLGSLASLWGALQRAAGATERLYDIVDTVPEIRDPEDAVPVPAGGGAVAFEHVDFTYAIRADHPVLHDVTLHVAPGEVVALVGPSGAGKSTLTALVPRFFDPTRGRVTFEATDVRRLRIAELRQHIAMVPQETVLFSGSIADNIAYGREGSAREAIEAAARDANAHEFIVQFPDGYDTQVGERGVQLSGGQRQRIAIARAILADPRVLILDEATSNLDAESESLVQAALARLMKNRTTLVIAHRLSTIRNADRIVVLDAGRIVEEGKHDELMARGGVYRRLVEHQLVS